MIDEERLAREAADRRAKNEAQRQAKEQALALERERLNAAPAKVEETTTDGADCLRFVPDRRRDLWTGGAAIANWAIVIVLGAGTLWTYEMGLPGLLAPLATAVGVALTLWTLASHLRRGWRPVTLLCCKSAFFALATETSRKTLAEGEKKEIWVLLVKGTLTSQGKRWRGGFQIIRNGRSFFELERFSPADFERVRAFCGRNDITVNEKIYEGTHS